MSKRKSPSRRSRQTDKAGGSGPDSGDEKGRQRAGDAASSQKHGPSPAAIRETIESVVVAFVLAFLFRTFEAEAFVIPTGSMAPTLMGRHKDLECPKCGYQYQASASDEVDSNTNAKKGRGFQVVGCICPMCRFPFDLRSAVASELGDELTGEIERILTERLNLPPEVAAELAEKIETKPAREIQDELINELDLSYGRGKDVAEELAEEIDLIIARELKRQYPSFKGDRILVGKFCYQFSEPDRWDVAVFKWPGGAKTNFIKRLVGLPGETIRIQHGDIWVKRGEEKRFTIARKEQPRKLLAMLQPVYDNDYVLPELIELGWPARWQAWPSARGSSQRGWKTSKDCESFRTDGRAAGETWLRYQHFVPSPEQWQYLEAGQLPPGNEQQWRQLISDFCSYNTNLTAGEVDAPPAVDRAGLHWVGDLALECTLEVFSDTGEAVLELVEGGWRMQCRIDLATGKATLGITQGDASGQPAQTIDGKAYRPTAQTAVRGPGKHKIIFSNCDDQLRLWVDGKVVRFDTATSYKPLNNWRPQDTSFASDFSPVGIGSKGAELRISHLKILRDSYYIAEKNSRSDGKGALTDFQRVDHPHTVLSDSRLWSAFDTMQVMDFPLKEDQFFALGDNSPKSKDSRLWEHDGYDHFVKRDLLIGKALYIYWPHSWDKLPRTNIWFPLFPNVSRMRFVR